MPITPAGTGDFNLLDWLRRRLGGPFVEQEDARHRALIASPLVQDTLYPLAGGPPTSSHVSFSPFTALRGNVGGMNRLTRGVTLSPGFSDNLGIYAHEMGHVADARNVYPGADQVADANAQYYRSDGNGQEYEAHLFQRAFELILEAQEATEGNADLAYNYLATRVNRENAEAPGTAWMVDQLLSSKTFSGTPLGFFHRQRRDQNWQPQQVLTNPQMEEFRRRQNEGGAY